VRAEGLELVLFSRDPEDARQAFAAGVDAFIVDWEERGKEERQRKADTEIDPGTADDLERLVRTGPAGAPVWCRVNGVGGPVKQEVESAVAAGAHCVLLPMVRETGDVERFLELVGGRTRVGILVETEEAVRRLEPISRLPLDVVYVGLNDLAISRGYVSLFEGLADGTVDRVRSAFPRARFGFGGVTTVDGGAPIPALELLGEIERVGCDFSFLRRSFRRDVAGRDAAAEVARIRSAWRRLRARNAAEREHDRRAVCARIAACVR